MSIDEQPIPLGNGPVTSSSDSISLNSSVSNQPLEKGLILDPDLKSKLRSTGLTAPAYRFDVENKSKFLRLAIEYWPNITAICKACGISRDTYYNHRKMDPAFDQALKDIDDMVCDELENVLRTEGAKPKGFLDRMAYLRAHRPELYDKAKVVKIEGYKMSEQERGRRLNVVETVIDAEVSKTYLDRRERQEKRAQQRLDQASEQREDKGGAGG